MEQLVARQVHGLEVVGSSPAPAMEEENDMSVIFLMFVQLPAVGCEPFEQSVTYGRPANRYGPRGLVSRAQVFGTC